MTLTMIASPCTPTEAISLVVVDAADEGVSVHVMRVSCNLVTQTQKRMIRMMVMLTTGKLWNFVANF